MYYCHPDGTPTGTANTFRPILRFLVASCYPPLATTNDSSSGHHGTARLLPAHWQQRYGYQPVPLETFVQKDRFAGTCYKAANWKYLGETKGRGKLDRHKRYVLPVKQVYVYPLRKDFRAQLCG